MSQYGNIDQAIAGLKADNNANERIESRACQESNGIQFGQTVWGYLGDSEKGYGFYVDTSKIVLDSDFASGDIVKFTVNGTDTANVTFTTDHDTTMDLCVAAITALTGVDAALDADDANNRTIYVRTKGLTNTTTMTDVGGSPPAETITTQSDQVFLGVAMFVQKDISATNTAKYDQYQDISVVSIGIIWAFLNGTCLSEDIAYTVNSGTGKFDDTAGNTINAVFRSNNYTNPTTSDVIAKVELKGSYKPNAQIAWV